MRLPVLALLASPAALALHTAPSCLEKRATCTVYAHTVMVHLILGQVVKRRRVVFDTTKRIPADRYDPDMYALGWRWAECKEKCNADIEELHVYYHGTVVPGGAYVIDSSEEESWEGDVAHECLLERFRTLLVEELDCALAV